ncbi:MAG: hypothetical protein C4523_09060 [Myxococcales bacterium]|nr:MAG: hypothetical protein C4523_09060 [Myxococcales bacterium]
MKGGKMVQRETYGIRWKKRKGRATWRRIAVLLALVAIGSMDGGAAQAKEGEFGLTLAAGSGYLVGYTPDKAAPDSTITARNPAFLDLDLQYEATPHLAPSLRLEMTVEQGGALTIVPNLVFDSDGDKVTVFGRTGVAIRTEPNYYGLDFGVGVIWHFIRHLGFVAEFNVEPLFLGDGLTGGIVVPLLGFAGFRGNV